MSCWVVPSIAAEMWGVSVNQILDGVKSGSIPSKSEQGFTFVDLAPDSPVFVAPKPRPALPPPPTYRILSREEIIALVGDASDEFETDEDWRIGRSEASRMRRPPHAIAA